MIPAPRRRSHRVDVGMLSLALLSLSQAEDAETCDAKDASAGNAAGSAKSLVLPSNAGHLVISVDDLEDRVVEGEAEGPPRSRSAWCQVGDPSAFGGSRRRATEPRRASKLLRWRSGVRRRGPSPRHHADRNDGGKGLPEVGARLCGAV